MSVRIRAATLALLVCSSAVAAPQEAREQLNAVLWAQSAPEYAANSRLVYRQATERLSALKREQATASIEQAASRKSFKNLRAAIVMDIDETVLDNGAYNAAVVKARKPFDHADFRWNDWVLAKAATAVPGSAEFIAQARKRGFQLLFVTNRACNAKGGYADGKALDCPQQAATIDNIEKVFGFKPADEQVLMRFEREHRDDKDKKARREEVAANHRIAMLVGDDLGDFVRVADYDDARHDEHWGADWFVLTNPMYGSWEQGRTLEQKYASLQVWKEASAPRPLQLKSWNLEWLASPASLRAADFWNECRARKWSNERLEPDLPYCDVYKRDGILSATQYEARKLGPLRASLKALAESGMDILAVQEVQNADALAAVLPADYQVVCFTSRRDAQNIGFAARRELAAGLTCEELFSLSLEDGPPGDRAVRRGLVLTASMGGKPVKILNVHLKSSCPMGTLDNGSNEACRTLQRQAIPLEAWVETQARLQTPFVIIGDFNRNLEQEVGGNFPARSDASDPASPLDPAKLRNLFPELNDGVPADSGLRLIRLDRSASAAHACHDILDQLVISDLLLNSVLSGTLPQAKLVLGQKGASDHCAISTML
jgi:acid phosphatase